jgi:hypothetical protein
MGRQFISSKGGGIQFCGGLLAVGEGESYWYRVTMALHRVKTTGDDRTS